MYTHAVHVGVDLGTTRTAAAVVTEEDGAVARAVRLGQSTDAASSAVLVAGDGLLHGDAAERRAIGDPSRLLRETKRRVGDDIPLIAGGRSYRPEEIYALSVAWAVRAVAEQEGGEIDSVTVTVPATWGAGRRRAIGAALAERGVNAALVDEPAAAAAHYCATHDVPLGALLAVYDFGGGTFDLAFVRHDEDGDAVIHTAGIAELGGADFDDAVFAHVVSSLDGDTPVGTDPVALAALRRECVNAKEALSFDPAATVPVLHCGTTVRLVRSEFEAMIAEDIARTVEVFARARADAGLADEDIHAVLLSGGSSRIPQVAQQLSDAFDLPLRVDADPKLVVALGAARLGAQTARSAAAPIIGTAPAAASVPSPLTALRPAHWGLAVAATAACAIVGMGVATTTSMSAALSGVVVAAPAGDLRALFDAPDSRDRGLVSAPLAAASFGDGSGELPVPIADPGTGATPAPIIVEPVPGSPIPFATITLPRTRPDKPTTPTPTPTQKATTTTPARNDAGTGETSSARGGGDSTKVPAHTSTTTPVTTRPDPVVDEPTVPAITPTPSPTPDPEPTTDPVVDPEPTTEPEPTTPTETPPAEVTPDPAPSAEPEPVTPAPDPEPTTPEPEPTAAPEPSPDVPVAQ